jgi:hypothetical protein
VATTIDRRQRPFPSRHDDNSGFPPIYCLSKRYIRLIVDAFTRVGFADFLVRMSEMPDATCQSFQDKTLGKQLKLAVWKHRLTIQYSPAKTACHANTRQWRRSSRRNASIVWLGDGTCDRFEKGLTDPTQRH